MKEKTYVEDIDRSMYDFRNEEKDTYKVKEGLTPAIVEQISKEKNDPAWMQLFRLQSLQIYNSMKIPNWGPPIDGLNMDEIVTYVRPNTKMSAKWSDVPEDIKDTFERLGIPQAERKSLAGVGAQYDSELVYHNVKAEVAAQGVVYTDEEGDLVTSIVNQKDCVFTCYDEKGYCYCAIEKAFRAGKTDFYKPISCHLYPIRIGDYGPYKAVNYHRWDVCKAAVLLGKKENLPVYKFLKEPLVRKFGEEWYKELEVAAEELKKRGMI